MPMCILYKAFSMPFVIYNRLDDCSIGMFYELFGIYDRVMAFMFLYNSSFFLNFASQIEFYL